MSKPDTPSIPNGADKHAPSPAIQPAKHDTNGGTKKADEAKPIVRDGEVRHPMTPPPPG